MPTPTRLGEGAMAAALAVAAFVVSLPYLDLSMLSMRRAIVTKVSVVDLQTDDSLLSGDEGTILSNADRVSRGHALYREVFDFKGPIGYLPYVIAFKLVAPTVRNGRLTMFVILGLWTAVMYGVARRVTASRLTATVVALLVPFQFWQMWAYAYQDFTAQLFLALAVLAGLVAFESPSQPAEQRRTKPPRQAVWWLFASGASAAMSLWTSLAQGLTGLVALWFAVALVAALSQGPRAAVRGFIWFGAGALGATAAILAWLGSMGAIRDGLSAIWVFPFKHYMSSVNITEYAYDENLYPAGWGQHPIWVVTALRIMMKTTRYAPFAGLIAAAVAAAWLVTIAGRRVVSNQSSRAVPNAIHLSRVLLPVALAATAVPVLLNKTRSDMCHLGFIEGGCILAFIALVALRPRNDAASRVVRGAVTIALAGALAAAVGFVGHAWYAKSPDFADPDVLGRASRAADAIAARTDPGDRIFVTPSGGWTYFFSRRDNATSFALLLNDPYSVEQWPIAAREIVEHLPKFLAVSDQNFEILASHRPVLKSLYFGSAGNYILDQRGDGPPFAVPARWRLTQFASDDRRKETRKIDLDVRGGGREAKLLVSIVGQSGDLLASLQRDKFSLYEGNCVYVAPVSPDAKTMEGLVFETGVADRPFKAQRLSP